MSVQEKMRCDREAWTMLQDEGWKKEVRGVQAHACLWLDVAQSNYKIQGKQD
jgi:hypothetical protein